jgi:hypothetical protein
MATQEELVAEIVHDSGVLAAGAVAAELNPRREFRAAAHACWKKRADCAGAAAADAGTLDALT